MDLVCDAPNWTELWEEPRNGLLCVLYIYIYIYIYTHTDRILQLHCIEL